MNKTTIAWTDYTWNPVTGCHKVSAGCKNCYAEGVMNRFGKSWKQEDFREIKLHTDRVNEPIEMGKKLHGKKVFVCSMSDLFHDQVPFEFIIEVFQVMGMCKDTVFQVLTKRPERALEFFRYAQPVFFNGLREEYSPVSNIWVGVSCEDQATADERIPVLLKIPAAIRFVSLEPLLGPVKLVGLDKREHPLQTNFYDVIRGLYVSVDHKCRQVSTGCPKIDWVIVGGESGHNARPMNPEWVRSIIKQCGNLVPVFFKQWGEWVDNPNYPIHSFRSNERQHVFGSGYFSTEVWRVGSARAPKTFDGILHHNFPSL